MSDLNKLIDDLSSLTILEAAGLCKSLEEKWGVSAVAPVAVQATADSSKGASDAEEKTEFAINLLEFGSSKISVIKEIRTITGLGLKEAKELVEAAPKVIKESVKKEEAEKIKAQLEKVGAKVELK